MSTTFVKNYRILNILTSQNMRCNINKKASYYAASAFYLDPKDRLSCEMFAYSMIVNNEYEKALEIISKFEEDENVVISPNLIFVRYRANLALGNKEQALQDMKQLIQMRSSSS